MGSEVQVLPGPPRGGVAQLGERVLCKHEVIGSIPFTSTILDSLGNKVCQKLLVLRLWAYDRFCESKVLFFEIVNRLSV